jgi:hypothetical protein
LEKERILKPPLTVVEPDATAASPRAKSLSRGAKLAQEIERDFEELDAADRERIKQIARAVDRLDDIERAIDADGGVMAQGVRRRRVHPLLKVEASLRGYITRELRAFGVEDVEDNVGRPARGFGWDGVG